MTTTSKLNIEAHQMKVDVGMLTLAFFTKRRIWLRKRLIPELFNAHMKALNEDFSKGGVDVAAEQSFMFLPIFLFHLDRETMAVIRLKFSYGL